MGGSGSRRTGGKLERVWVPELVSSHTTMAWPGEESMTARRSLHRVLKLFGVIEVLGAAVGAAGVAVEIAYQADIGFILITGGALTFAIGSGLFAKVWVGRTR